GRFEAFGYHGADLGPGFREVVSLVEEKPRAGTAKLELEGRSHRLKNRIQADGARHNPHDSARGHEQQVGTVRPEVPERDRSLAGSAPEIAPARTIAAGPAPPEPTWKPGTPSRTCSNDSREAKARIHFSIPSGSIEPPSPALHAAYENGYLASPWAAPAIARNDSPARSSSDSVSVERCQSAPSGHMEAALTSPAFADGATAPRSASTAGLFSRMHSPPASILPFTARRACNVWWVSSTMTWISSALGMVDVQRAAIGRVMP